MLKKTPFLAQEGPLQPSRRACSWGKKGVFLKQEGHVLVSRRTKKIYINAMLSFIIQTLILLSFQSSAYILMLFISCADRADDFRVSTI